MTIILIILAYIISVFLSRRLNYLEYQNDKNHCAISTVLWFIPILNLTFTFLDYWVSCKKNKTWFTGKNW